MININIYDFANTIKDKETSYTEAGKSTVA